MKEAAGVRREFEVADIVINTSNWGNQPFENSTRLVTGSCSGNGTEIPSQIYNKTVVAGYLQNFNLVFEANSSEFEQRTYSIYYSSSPKNRTTYNSILAVRQTQSWWVETDIYHFYYSLRSDEGLTVMKFVKDGDRYTNYAGSLGNTPLSILDAGPVGRFNNLSTGPLCFIYQRGNLTENVICRLCKSSPVISCEHTGNSPYSVKNHIFTWLFYGQNSSSLYYRTNLDSSPKPSNIAGYNMLQNFRYGVANTTKGTNFITVITNGTQDYSVDSQWTMINSLVYNDSFGLLLSTNPSITWRKALVAVTNESLDSSFQRTLNYSMAVDHPLDENFTLSGEHQINPKTEIRIKTEPEIIEGEPFDLLVDVQSDSSPLANLSSEDFHFSLGSFPIQKISFDNFLNGSYLFSTSLDFMDFGYKKINLKVNISGEDFFGDAEVLYLMRPGKSLILTGYDYENYTSAVLTGQPVLIYESNREFIDYYIREYQPSEVFQLGTNLALNNSHTVDSLETLHKIFPKIEGSRPTETDYIILSNTADKMSMFSVPYSIIRGGLVINATGSAEETKQILISEISRLHIPDSYIFEKNIFLLLVGTPTFTVDNPLPFGEPLNTDTPYGDVDDDGHLDLSVGRLLGSPESMSFQIEYSKFLQNRKTALLLSSYNIPAKYFDVLTGGGTLEESLGTEMTLRKKGFSVTKIVEKRSDYDELDFSVLQEVKEFFSLFGLLSGKNYEDLFGEAFGSVNSMILLAKAGDFLMYSIHEFDWSSWWNDFLNGQPSYPRHLPVLNEDNLLDNTGKNQIIIYYSKGNSTNWFLPINTTRFETEYKIFDPSNLDFNPAFYYIKHDYSSNIVGKIFDRGAVAAVAIDGQVSELHSGRFATVFFKNFDKPIGVSLKEAKNWNLETSNASEFGRHFCMEEYYKPGLIGDPALSFDPQLILEKTIQPTYESGTFKVNFTLRPSYRVLDYGGRESVLFEDFDDELIFEMEPPTPLYSEEFILPSDTTVFDVSVRPLKVKNFDNTTINSFDMEFFYGQWPEKNFWSSEASLLDGRKEFKVFVSPVIYFENGTTVVFEEVEISFHYTSPVEILELVAGDIYQSHNQRINFTVLSGLNSSISMNASLLIDNGNTKTLEKATYLIEPGVNKLSYQLNGNNYLGPYSVALGLTNEDYSIGPKYTHFNVSQEPNATTIKNSTEPSDESQPIPSSHSNFSLPVKLNKVLTEQSFIESLQNFFERFYLEKTVGKEYFHYKIPGKEIWVDSNDGATKSYFYFDGKELTIYEYPGSVIYTLQTSDGEMILEKNRGSIGKYGEGNLAVLERDMEQAMRKYGIEANRITGK